MRFLDVSAARDWCNRAGVAPEAQRGSRPTVRCAVPSTSTRLTRFAGWLVVTVPAVGERLLWVRETGIWPSSENWTFIQRLRQGYGESRGVAEAPAIAAADDEIDDLAGFVLVVLMAGWDADMFGTQDLLQITISHDEWVEFSASDPGLIGQIEAPPV